MEKTTRQGQRDGWLAGLCFGAPTLELPQIGPWRQMPARSIGRVQLDGGYLHAARGPVLVETPSSGSGAGWAWASEN